MNAAPQSCEPFTTNDGSIAPAFVVALTGKPTGGPYKPQFGQVAHTSRLWANVGLLTLLRTPGPPRFHLSDASYFLPRPATKKLSPTTNPPRVSIRYIVAFSAPFTLSNFT